MAPTPITATHRLSIAYQVSGLTHHMRVLCDAFPTILFGSGWGVTSLDALSNEDVADFASDLADDIAPYFYDGDPISGWELHEYSGGAYVFKAGGSLSQVGTGGTTSHLPATEMTLFLRDSANKPVKVILLEGNFPLAVRYTSIGSMPAALRPLPTNLLDHTAGKSGNYVRSRGNHGTDRFIAVVTALNRKVRRSRSIA